MPAPDAAGHGAVEPDRADLPAVDPVVPVDGAPRPGAPTVAPLVATVALLAAYNVARGTVVPASAHLGTNLAVAGVVALLAWWAGLTARELGLETRRLGAGLRWGGATFLLILVVVGGAALASKVLPSAGDAFTDTRVQVPVGDLLYETLVNTPFGTVVLEELAFRGVLLALFRRRLRTGYAVLWCSLLFGCWHIFPSITTAAGNRQLADAAATTAGLALVVAGNVLSTSVAGAIFCWLRLRSHSLLAPVLAHLGTNDISFTVAWLSNR